jgi:hypothetical protein
MRYRTLIDHPRPADADFDVVDAEAGAMRALRDKHLAMLARMGEIGMDLMEAIAQGGQADPAHAVAAGQAFAKVSQAVRRTIALQLRLSREAGADEAQWRDARETRCADEVEAHREVKDFEIIHGVADAWAAGCTEQQRERDQPAFDRLMDDADLALALDDGDDLNGYLDRPVGETVARLCAILGLDADACKFEDGEWRVRRPLSRFEEGCEAFARRRAAPAGDSMSDPPPAPEARAPPCALAVSPDGAPPCPPGP